MSEISAPKDPRVTFKHVCGFILGLIRRRNYAEARSRANVLYTDAAGYPGYQGRALMYLLECRVKQGDFLSLESLARQAVALLRGSEFPASAMRVLRLYAMGLLQWGRIDEARAVLAEAIALEQEIKPKTEEDENVLIRGQFENRIWQGFCELTAFDIEGAAEYRQQAERFFARGAYDVWNKGEYFLLHALVTLPSNRTEAQRLFDEALNIFSSTDDPIDYDRARALDLWGRATGNVALVDQAILLYKQLPNPTLMRLASEWKETEGKAYEAAGGFKPTDIELSDEALLKAVSAVKSEGAPLIVPGVSTREKLREAWRLGSRSHMASKLIVGETGTGKLVLAHTLHAASPYAKGPFVRVPCNELTATLFEPQLFGYRKGAFTGATEDRIGYIEQANGGTLFLDEIHQLSRENAAKLLAVLDERVVRPVGATKGTPVDIHVVAATNENLWERSAQGEFPVDLVFRLAKVLITTTPLRERPDEISVLAEHIVQHYAGLNGYTHCRLEPEAIEVLTTYRWPGNVRDLDRVLLRAVIEVADRPIDVPALLYAAAACFIDLGYKDPVKPQVAPDATGNPVFDSGVAKFRHFLTSPNPMPFSTSPQAIADSLLAEVILRALEVCNGNATAAAKVCKMAKNTYRDYLERAREAVAMSSDAPNRAGDETDEPRSALSAKSRS